MPQSRAGHGPSLEVDTTSTPSANSLMPTAFPTGIKVRWSAHTVWQHRAPVSSTASSHAAGLRMRRFFCVSYMRSPLFLNFVAGDRVTLRESPGFHVR